VIEPRLRSAENVANEEEFMSFAGRRKWGAPDDDRGLKGNKASCI
jgi:hypothetical protein